MVLRNLEVVLEDGPGGMYRGLRERREKLRAVFGGATEADVDRLVERQPLALTIQVRFHSC
jgi:hypothetical protein